MRKRSLIRFILIVAVIAVIAVLALCDFNIGIYKVKSLFSLVDKGLDLGGGVEVIYRVTPKDTDARLGQVVNDVVTVQKQRLAAYGYRDASVTRSGQDRICVQIPAAQQDKSAVDVLSRAGEVTFRFADDKVVLTGDHIVSAASGYLQDGSQKPAVSFQLDEEGTEIFKNITTEHADEILFIYLDEDLIANPVIGSPITDGVISITNVQTIEAARKLAGLISAGGLNAELETVSQNEMEPQMNDAAITLTALCLVLAMVLLIAFWCITSRMTGVMAGVSLVINTLIVLFLVVTVSGCKWTQPMLLALSAAQIPAILGMTNMLGALREGYDRSNAALVRAYSAAEKERQVVWMVIDGVFVLMGLLTRLSADQALTSCGFALFFGGIAAAVTMFLIFPFFAKLGFRICDGKPAAALFGSGFTKKTVKQEKLYLLLYPVAAICGVIALLCCGDVQVSVGGTVLVVLAAVVLFGASTFLFGKRESSVAIALGVLLDTLCAALFVTVCLWRLNGGMLALMLPVCAFSGAVRLDRLKDRSGAPVILFAYLLVSDLLVLIAALVSGSSAMAVDAAALALAFLFSFCAVFLTDGLLPMLRFAVKGKKSR